MLMYACSCDNQNISRCREIIDLPKSNSEVHLMDPCPSIPGPKNPIKQNAGMAIPRTVEKESVRRTLGNRLGASLRNYGVSDYHLKGLYHPACLARAVSWLAFVVAIFMGHENGNNKGQ